MRAGWGWGGEEVGWGGDGAGGGAGWGGVWARWGRVGWGGVVRSIDRTAEWNLDATFSPYFIVFVSYLAVIEHGPGGRGGGRDGGWENGLSLTVV